MNFGRVDAGAHAYQVDAHGADHRECQPHLVRVGVRVRVLR